MPDARLDLSAKRVNCHGFYTGFGTKPFSKEGCLITQKEVNAVFDGQVALCREILQKKTKEYTGGDTDRLGAFKAAAALQHTTPERALAGMLAKHIVSLYDMCFADGMFYVLAGTVRQKDWDGRISRDNKAWAKTIPVYENPDGFGQDRNVYFVVDRSHPGLVDLFLTQARLDYTKEHGKKVSIREGIKQSTERTAAVHAPTKRKEPER